MSDDPILEETRRLRDEYAAQFDYDLDAIIRDLRAREAKHPERMVPLPPAPDEKRSNAV